MNNVSKVLLFHITPPVALYPFTCLCVALFQKGYQSVVCLNTCRTCGKLQLWQGK